MIPTIDISVETLPTYVGPENVFSPAYKGDAGVDLYAAEDVVLLPGERTAVRTGIKIAIPYGYEGQVRPRSGNAVRLGLTVINTPGTIDAEYRGEILVPLYNANPLISVELLDWLCLDQPIPSSYVDSDIERRTIRIKAGDKIAQMVFSAVVAPIPKVVDSLPPSSRGEKGFGSSGVVGQV